MLAQRKIAWTCSAFVRKNTTILSSLVNNLMGRVHLGNRHTRENRETDIQGRILKLNSRELGCESVE
jgi:hypothetical protein